MAVLQALALLLALLLVMWILLGGPTRSRERRAAQRRRGGRTAKDGSFWGPPARDRPYTPGMLLLLFVVVALAEVTVDAAAEETSGPATTAAILGAIIAVGYRFRPDIVAAGMGVVGIVSLVLQRMGARGCDVVPAAAADNGLWLLASAAVLAAVVGLRFIVAPIAMVRRSISAGSRIWSLGSERGTGAIGQAALVVFGVLDLLDLVISPTGVHLFGQGWASSLAVPVFALAGGLVLAFGLAVLPAFTTSVTGLVVGVGHLLALTTGDGCRDVGTVVATAAAFFGMWWLAQRLR